ncbi:MAG: lamin tail domain-containing protein [Candidatus Kuenenbacteria bacterium]
MFSHNINLINIISLIKLSIIAFLGIFLFPISIQAANPGDVIINEIAWMGTVTSATDEWIELKNNTSEQIDLTDWTLVAEDGKPNITLDGVIEAQAYFLLERTDDESVPDITADWFGSFGTGLNNNGEKLELRDNNNILINVVDCTDGWSAGDNDQKLTMERTADLNWQNSKDVGGTPKAANSSGQAEESDQSELPPDEENQEPDQSYTYEYSNQIVINELYPNPQYENDEWIELKNLSDQSIDLFNWSISDSSGKIYTISASTASSTLILSQGFFMLNKSQTKMSLNNNGDIISLYNPAGQSVYSIEYEDTYEEWSYARDEDDSWLWTTTPTKNTDNEFNLPPPADSGGGSSNTTANTGHAYSVDIIISEFLPNPKGSDSAEWIELYNQGGTDIDLLNWQLGDNSSHKYTVQSEDFDNTIIQSNKHFVLPRSATGIALNNSGGDQVKLYQPDGSLLDKIIYNEKAQENFSYALISNQWLWTSTATPNTGNIFTEENDPPTASFEIDGNLVNQPIIFDASESYDPEGENLIYFWNFGDATTTTATTTQIIEHIFDKIGNYVITLTVEDNEGEINTQEENLTITAEFIDLAKFTESTDIIITELLPNPAGSDTELEWIEIFNQGQFQVNLANWQIDDAEKGSRPYTITDELIISPGEYLVFYRPTTKIAFNNSYDSARLFDGQGNLADEISYDEVIEDASYALDVNYTWHWTYALTPGMPNIVDITTVPAASGKKTANEIPLVIELQNIRQQDFGDLIKVTGRVAVEPGTLGKNIFYIVGSSGIQVYCFKKDFPALVIGDYVEITGTLSESRGETRIKIKDKNDIRFINSQKQPVAQRVQIEDIDENLEGALIEIQGELTEAKSSSWWLDDGTEEVKVYIKQSTGITKGDINVGDTLKIIGIVSQWDDEYRVLPRWPQDIEIIKAVKGASTINNNQLTVNKEQGSKIFKYLFAVACAIILILISLIIEQRKNKQDKQDKQ